MGMYESRKNRKKSAKDTEDAMLIASGDWFAVRSAQEIAKSWKRIVVISVLAFFILCAPAIGPLIRLVSSYL